MMNVSPSPSRINHEEFCDTSSTIADVSAYIDTLEMFSKRQPDAILMSRLREIQQRLVWHEPIVVRGTRWGYRLIVNQPRPEALQLIHDWAVKVRAIISRLHIACDFDPRSHVTREYVIDWLRRNMHLRYRRQTDETIEVGQTFYCVRTAGRKTRPSVNFAIYATRVGKLDGEVDKIHFEIRLENSRAIKSAKIEAPKDLITINPRALFDRYVKTGSADDFINRVIKRTIDQTRPTPLINVERRVRAIMMRTGCDTLTGIKQYYPRAFERMKRLDVLSISDRLEWVRPGVIDEGGGGNVVFVTRTSKTTSHPQRKSALARKTTRRIRLNLPPKRTRDGDDLARSRTPDTSRPRKAALYRAQRD